MTPSYAACIDRLQETDLTSVLLTNTGGEDETVAAVFADAVTVALVTVALLGSGATAV